jgi:hypothetical protein
MLQLSLGYLEHSIRLYCCMCPEDTYSNNIKMSSTVNRSVTGVGASCKRYESAWRSIGCPVSQSHSVLPTRDLKWPPSINRLEWHSSTSRCRGDTWPVANTRGHGKTKAKLAKEILDRCGKLMAAAPRRTAADIGVHGVRVRFPAVPFAIRKGAMQGSFPRSGTGTGPSLVPFTGNRACIRY